VLYRYSKIHRGAAARPRTTDGLRAEGGRSSDGASPGMYGISTNADGAASGVQPSYAAGYGSRLARSSPKSSSVTDMTSTVADAAAGRASPVPAAPALGAQPASPTSATVHRAVESRSKHVRRRFVASSATLSSRTYASAPGQPRASYGRVRDACTISNLEYELGLERVRERQHAARRKCAQDAPGRLHVLHAR
jgi:hypothetical protein